MPLEAVENPGPPAFTDSPDVRHSWCVQLFYPYLGGIF